LEIEEVADEMDHRSSVGPPFFLTSSFLKEGERREEEEHAWQEDEIENKFQLQSCRRVLPLPLFLF